MDAPARNQASEMDTRLRLYGNSNIRIYGGHQNPDRDSVDTGHGRTRFCAFANLIENIE